MLLAGELTPVFFGSALANFGVQSFLNAYVDHAPMPNGRITKEAEEVSPFSRRILVLIHLLITFRYQILLQLLLLT